jgi:hypothetical protein
MFYDGFSRLFYAFSPFFAAEFMAQDPEHGPMVAIYPAV